MIDPSGNGQRRRMPLRSDPLRHSHNLSFDSNGAHADVGFIAVANGTFEFIAPFRSQYLPWPSAVILRGVKEEPMNGKCVGSAAAAASPSARFWFSASSTA